MATMTKRVLVLVALLAGCGGDGPVAPAVSRLLRSWTVQLSDMCAYGMAFRPDGTYGAATFCVDSAANRNDAYKEAGTFTEDPPAGRIHFMVEESTCPDTQKLFYDEYAVTDATLTITTAVDVTVLVPSAAGDPGTGIEATLGCFRMGKFTPSPLAPIP